MSGILSLYRELYALYHGSLPPQHVFWSCTWIAFALSASVLWYQEFSAKKRVQLSLKRIEEARPRIVPREPNPVSITTVRFGESGRRLFDAPFVRIRFTNDPLHSYPGAMVDGVVAKVRFLRERQVLLEMDGRWSDSDQPSTRDWRQSRNDLLSTNFGIGSEHDLDIAFKDVGTGEVFAWNNDNYNYIDTKKPEHLLTGDLIDVEVRLRGPWVDSCFQFQLRSVPHEGIEVTQPLAP